MHPSGGTKGGGNENQTPARTPETRDPTRRAGDRGAADRTGNPPTPPKRPGRETDRKPGRSEPGGRTEAERGRRGRPSPGTGQPGPQGPRKPTGCTAAGAGGVSEKSTAHDPLTKTTKKTLVRNLNNGHAACNMQRHSEAYIGAMKRRISSHGGHLRPTIEHSFLAVALLPAPSSFYCRGEAPLTPPSTA